MKDKIDIRLRLIQQDSDTDKENYFALQKSVAILKNWEPDNIEELNEQSWQENFKKNRICYVIEKMSGNVYCGECAVKNISDEIPEIELMMEYQGQGIGYRAIIDMLNKLASDYGKENFYAKIDPDNHASRFLFEKLCGQPAGVVRDYAISDDRVEQFTERTSYLLDQNLEKLARKFGVDVNVLLTHFVVYKINVNDVNESHEAKALSNHRKKEFFGRSLTREKYMESIWELLEGLQQIRESTTKEKLKASIDGMAKKWMERVDKMSENVNLS